MPKALNNEMHINQMMDDDRDLDQFHEQLKNEQQLNNQKF